MADKPFKSVQVATQDPDTGIETALALGRGASFTVNHVCPDGQATHLYWDNEATYERTWLMCPRCKFAVQLVTRWPNGKVNAPVAYAPPSPPPDPGPCPVCGYLVGDVAGHVRLAHRWSTPEPTLRG